LLEGSPIIYQDELLHPVYNTTFSEGGRLSAEDPNVQNFPSRDDEAKEVRKQIKPEQGIVAAFDYGQIEARVIAMMSKDKVFVDALWQEFDVHMDWAKRLSRVYPDRVGGKQNFTDQKVMGLFRKDINNQWTFPLFFGAQLSTVAEYINIPENYLKQPFNEFWKTFSGVRDWQEELRKFYNTYGYVEQLSGRRRHGPLSFNQLINSPVQGMACEIVMDGMNRLSKLGNPVYQANLNVHDDLTFMWGNVNKVDEYAETVISSMLAVPFKFINVPLTVEMSIGPDWLNMKKVGTYSSDTWGK
jgi:DNA polymerase-1